MKGSVIHPSTNPATLAMCKSFGNVHAGSTGSGSLQPAKVIG